MAKEFYTGSVDPLAGVVGSTIIGPLPWRAAAEQVLDSGRDEAAPSSAAWLRSSAVWAAASIPDAAAIAAIRAYSPTRWEPYEAMHVYRVALVPNHIGPVAVIDVLHERLEVGAATIEPLIREYWSPTGTWHLQEILAESLSILEELPTISELDIYLRRWVHYNLDRARAEALK